MPRALVLALTLAAGLVLVPLWPWLVLAVWIGTLGRALVPALTRLTGRRQRAVAVLTVALLTVAVVPLGLLLVSLASQAVALVTRLLESGQSQAIFETLVSTGDAGGGARSNKPMDLLVAHGASAWLVVRVVASTATHAVIGLVVFVAGAYVVMADGPAAYTWLARHLPLSPGVLRRFADAFMETGRGLMLGVLGAGFAQAVLATIAYAVIGVPQPLVLGLLTLIASVVPAIGTAFVWAPVAVALAVTGRPDAAVGLAAFGVLVIGTVDNLARPWLARRAELKLPAYMIMIAIFGGIGLVGPEGLLLGPLVLRLAKEALEIAREDRDRVLPLATDATSHRAD